MQEKKKEKRERKRKGGWHLKIWARIFTMKEEEKKSNIDMLGQNYPYPTQVDGTFDLFC